MTDLLTLQNRLKRDPEGYRDEFLQQMKRFLSFVSLIKSQPLSKSGNNVLVAATTTNTDTTQKGKTTKAAQKQEDDANAGISTVQSRRIQEFSALIAFLSHASPYYKGEVTTLNFPQELYTLLFQHTENLDPLLRKTLAQALILLQKRGLIERHDLLPALYRVFRCNDKELRKLVFSHIVNDLAKLHTTNPNTKITANLQRIIFKLTRDDNISVALKATHTLVELWKRNVWVSDKIVNEISQLCFTTHDKLISAALYFFLGDYDTQAQEDEERKEQTLTKLKEITDVSHNLKHMKRKMKRQRQIDREKKRIAQNERAMSDHIDDDDNDGTIPSDGIDKSLKSANMNPLRFIHDPQHFAERLFYKLKVSKETFQTRMLIMDVLSKLVGLHKVLLFNFYGFLQRYLQPHQRNVTSLLSFVIRATHNLVPPEVLHPVVKSIANNFINDRSTPEVVTIGINSIREICSRAPLVMNEDLLHDLTQYQKHKNKGIISATRSLINIFRELNPALLHKLDRGRDGQKKLLYLNSEEGALDKKMMDTNLQYGGQYIHRDIVGIELLEQYGLLNPGDDNNDEHWDPNNVNDDEISNLLDDDEDDDEDNDDDEDEYDSEDEDIRDMDMSEFFEGEDGFNFGEGEDGFNFGEGEDGLNFGEGEDGFGFEGENGFGEGEDGFLFGGDEGEDGFNFGEGENSFDFGEGEMGEGEFDLDAFEDITDDDSDIDVETIAKLEAEYAKEQAAKKATTAQKKTTTKKDEISQPTKKTKTVTHDDESMQLVQIAPSERRSTDLPKATLRILTPADFKKIEILRQKQLQMSLNKRKKETKGDVLDEDLLDEHQRIQAFKSQTYIDVDGDELETLHLKREKITKMERVKKQREAKRMLKLGAGNNNTMGRTITQEEKNKTKAYAMIKHSLRVQSKSQRSFKDKQSTARKHIKSTQNMHRNLKKKVAKR